MGREVAPERLAQPLKLMQGTIRMILGKRLINAVVAGFMVLLPAALPAQGSDPLAERARKILREVPLVDGHNDVPWQYHERVKNQLSQIDLRDTSALTPAMHTDIPRLKRGGVGAQFWSVYIPSTRTGAEGVRSVIEQIDVVHRMVQTYPETFELALTADDIVRIHKQGKIASLIGMEGGHSIGNSLGVLRMTYDVGARYMTLTHSLKVDWADSATDTPAHGGLTKFGEEVIREMNRLGMLVDLSHVSAETMNDVLDVTDAPVIFSHSSAFALTNHPRNVPDDVLARMPANGGVVMVTFVPSFVSQVLRNHFADQKAAEERFKYIHVGNPNRAAEELEVWKKSNPAPVATLSDVADHVDHIRKVAGIDHIGIGGDFDGITTVPTGLESVESYPNLFAELLRRGYSDEDIRKIAGLNALRVMRQAESVAKRLQAERPPSEATIEKLDAPVISADTK